MPTSGYSDLLEQPDLLYEGQPAITEEWLVRSGNNTDSVSIIFGRGVVKGAADDALLLPVDANSIFKGIAVESQAIERVPGVNTDGTGRMGWAPLTRMAYLIRGVVGVLVDQNVTEDAPAFCRFTAGSGVSYKGTFRLDADTGKAIAVPNSRFLKSGAAGTVVPLSINLA